MIAKLRETTVSYVVENCQVCGSPELQSFAFLGYLPPVNTMPAIGQRPMEQPSFPAEVLQCRHCKLVQLGLVVDKEILFPPSYPYTSGTTKILRENFADLYREVCNRHTLKSSDLCIDIGSNDGTLLSNFHNGGHRVLGIEPTNAGHLANERGIPTMISFFNAEAVERVVERLGKARIITAANCFAHIDDVNQVVENILDLLGDDGLFVSESHYLLSLVETLQYDTIYHEHMRYYSLTALKHLLERHGLEVIHARRIPTHGGSIRVYSARKGTYPVAPSVRTLLAEEAEKLSEAALRKFEQRIAWSKIELYGLVRNIKAMGQRIFGISAPSRASTLINYVGLDHCNLDCVLEIKGSYKIGKYIPGTMIPVLEETKLFTDQPEYALLLSWHIADELMPKLKSKGYRGDFIVPLPEPRIVRNQDI